MTASDRRTFLHQMAGGMAAFAIAPQAFADPLRSRESVNVGVVGVGRWGGRPLLTELAKFEQVKVTAVCDVQSSALRRARRRAPDAEQIESLADFLKTDVQAVIVATPTHTHKDVATACLDAGKHVYCEAPLAHTVEDARALAAAATRSSQVFAVGHTGRSNPVYRLARSFVRSGAIRDLMYLRAQSHQKNSWRSGSGSQTADWRLYKASSAGLVGELGTHQFDTIDWFTKKTPVKVRGAGATLAYMDGREHPDTAHCVLEYENGLRMLWDATLSNSFESNYEMLGGSMGTIKLADTHGWMFKEADAPQQGWEVYASRQTFHNDTGITLIADATKLANEGKDLTKGIGLPEPPLYYGLEAFLKSVLESKDVACTAMDALRSAVVGIRANEAVLSGTEVAIDPADYQLS